MKTRPWRLISALAAASAILFLSGRPESISAQTGTTANAPAAGETWSGTITEEEPLHTVLNGLETMSLTEYQLTMVEQVWPGGQVSLKLTSLNWKTKRTWKDVINRGYVHYYVIEAGQGACSGGTDGCSFSGNISLSEDPTRPTGIEGHYSLSIKARGSFYKNGWETGARHIATGPMSHRLEPTREEINESYEGSVGAGISGTLENDLTTMSGTSGNTSWSISKSGTSIKVEIEPVNKTDYENFIPGMRDSVSFRVRIVEPAGMIGYPYFKLGGVSVMPGYCMNAEIDSEDLSFIRSLEGLEAYDQEGPDWILDAPEGRYYDKGQLQDITGKDAYDEATISVMALDAGGIGRISGGMIINGVRYPGLVKNDGRSTLKLPCDSNSNLIADAAPQDKAARFQDDLDAVPAGNGVTGDGLSAYEEYRGFMVAGGGHVRTDIEKKTIFVRNRYGQDWAAYHTLGLEAYDLEEDQLPPAGERDKPGIINYFHPPKGAEYANVHAQDQYAVLIVKSLSPLLDGATAYVVGLHPPSAEYHTVYVLPEVFVRKQADHFPSITYEEYVRRLLDHELGHRIGIDHHGNIDKEKYRDRNGKRWWWAAVTGGEHSGWEDCAMRYNCADGILKDPATKEVIKYEPPPKVRGAGFCDQAYTDAICGPASVTTICREQFWIKSPISAGPTSTKPAASKGEKP